ncbi:MAG TPA: ABC transporter substrate-binding protein [Nannocystis sp.]
MTLSRRHFTACLSALALTGACRAQAENTGALRLGYFANITHAPALVGVERGLFREQLSTLGVELETFTFNAGPAAIEGLLSGALDATYVGPNPAVNAFIKSRGAVRVIAGAAAGGAFFVVRPDISGAADLRGKRVSAPQLGGTQDVALRTWLQNQGLQVDAFGGGDVSVTPMENAQTLERFQAGEIVGAWVPEPWATRLQIEGGGKVLVDERDLWPGGRFTTTVLLVREGQLKVRPEVYRALLRGHVAAHRWSAEHGEEAQAAVNAAIKKITGKALPAEVIARAWANLEFTTDPIPEALIRAAQDAERLGFVKLGKVDLTGLFALDLLKEVEAA